MYDISLVIQTKTNAASSDLQAIVRAHSTITSYVFDSHPDVFILKPLEDKVSISIDQVHALHGSINLSPVMGSQKVILVHPAHALTLPAQQALLKLVEEPPSKVLFMLVTHTPYVLLPTILSRCSLIQFSIVHSPLSISFEFPKNHAEAIKMSDEYGAKKETALTFIQRVISTETDRHIQKEAIKALGLLNKNINAKLVLDQFLFEIIKTNGKS